MACATLVATFTLLNPAVAADSAAPARDPDELKVIQQQITDTERQRAEDAAHRADLSAELQKLQGEAVASAAAIQTLERDLTRTEARILELGARDHDLSASLGARRARISPLLAALQRLQRDPPPALAVSPDDAVAAARGAMLIAEVARKLEQEAGALAQELGTLGQTRASLAAERDSALVRAQDLATRRTELAQLIARRQADIGTLDSGVADAAKRIARLQARTTDMRDLMAWVEKAPGAGTGGLTAAPATAPIGAKAPAFVSLHGQIRWPAAGVLAVGFGAPDEARQPSTGVRLKTRAEAQVTAPVDGEIVFAGPFAGYGRLLILAPGGDYFILIGGLGRLDAVAGQHVLAGEPLGATSGPDAKGETLMYLELRQKTVPVDPLPWFVPVEASG